MSTLQIVVLAVIQGITEFLPISSSGHLALAPHLAGWGDQGLLIDVAAHVGTLGAVIVYLRRDVWAMVLSALHPQRDESAPGLRLLLYLVIATIPVAVAGFLVKAYAGDSLRSIPVIAWTTLVFGVLLYASDRLGAVDQRIEHMSMAAALWIGLAQIAALVPGVSRAGITMTAARFLGFQRTDAARFSMLLSIPTIIGAGLLATADLIESGNMQLRADAALVAALAFVTALVTIMVMMRWLARATFMPFVVYRILLGAGLLVWWYF